MYLTMRQTTYDTNDKGINTFIGSISSTWMYSETVETRAIGGGEILRMSRMIMDRANSIALDIMRTAPVWDDLIFPPNLARFRSHDTVKYHTIVFNNCIQSRAQYYTILQIVESHRHSDVEMIVSPWI